MERPTCGTCPYYRAIQETIEFGTCRRHAPVPRILENEPDEYSDWPTIPKTLPDEWCGEHPDFPAYLQATRKAPGSL